jgi:hypothetical protein
VVHEARKLGTHAIQLTTKQIAIVVCCRIIEPECNDPIRTTISEVLLISSCYSCQCISDRWALMSTKIDPGIDNESVPMLPIANRQSPIVSCHVIYHEYANASAAGCSCDEMKPGVTNRLPTSTTSTAMSSCEAAAWHCALSATVWITPPTIRIAW